MDYNGSQNDGQSNNGAGVQPNTGTAAAQDTANGQFTAPQYTEGQNTNNQYDSSQYANNQYGGQYTNNQYTGSQDVNAQYTNGQYTNPQYTNPQYTGQPYGTNPYGAAPGYIPQPPVNPNNGFAIAALCCGIAGLLLCVCYGVGAIPGIAGIVFAILSRKQNGGKMSGIAVAGLVCGIIGVIFSILWGIYLFLVYAAIGDFSSGFSSFYNYY